MKNRSTSYFLYISCLLLVGTLAAQVPQTMSYQAVARNANGDCLADEVISLQISILGDNIDGPTVYVERFECSDTTNGVGHFQVDIGAGTPQICGEVQAFSDIPWNNRKHYLKVEYAPECTTAFVTVGTTELLSVPYALVAGNGKAFSNNNNDEFFIIRGSNQNLNATIGGLSNNTGTAPNYNLGSFTTFNTEGERRARLYTSPGSQEGGRIITYGQNGEINVQITTRSDQSHPNKGGIYVYDDSGASQGTFRVGTTGQGEVVLDGSGPTNANFVIGSSNNGNRGAMTIRDENNDVQVSFTIDGSRRGIVRADIKDFVMDHPDKDDKVIVYSCIEGPEVAAYERGTAKLVNGEANIYFSETFAIVGNPATMTVIVTPRSPVSKGLAAFSYTSAGFKVKELFDGSGSYEFDWEVKAKRKGFEDRPVIQNRIQLDQDKDLKIGTDLVDDFKSPNDEK